MVLGWLKEAIGRIIGGAAEEEVTGLAAAKSTLSAAIEETAYAGYRALTYAAPEEEIYFPSAAQPHSIYSHSWENIPTYYQSTYAADVWDEEAGEWSRNYYTIQHDDLLSEEDEEDYLVSLAVDYLGAKSAAGAFEFVGGKTQWPEYAEV